MAATQYVHAEKYESSEVRLFSQKTKEEPQNLAFLSPTMAEYLRSDIPGKKILDIGCGIGNWCYKAAECGAKSVDGFDIQEEMVELAKKANSKFNSVKIQVGDVMCMPYDDNMFDVAISFYVTCGLRLAACINHFKELYRVLTPGGKAMIVSYSQPVFENMFFINGADKESAEKKITTILKSLKQYPSQDVINDAFQSLDEVIQVLFTLDDSGHLQRILDVNTLTNGQAVWSYSQIITFADYYYSDQFFQQQIKAAGLKIDQIESYYTEERRIAYNSSNPEIKLDKGITDTPPFVMYHLSKPTKN